MPTSTCWRTTSATARGSAAGTRRDGPGQRRTALADRRGAGRCPRAKPGCDRYCASRPTQSPPTGALYARQMLGCQVCAATPRVDACPVRRTLDPPCGRIAARRRRPDASTPGAPPSRPAHARRAPGWPPAACAVGPRARGTPSLVPASVASARRAATTRQAAIPSAKSTALEACERLRRPGRARGRHRQARWRSSPGCRATTPAPRVNCSRSNSARASSKNDAAWRGLPGASVPRPRSLIVHAAPVVWPRRLEQLQAVRELAGGARGVVGFERHATQARAAPTPRPPRRPARAPATAPLRVARARRPGRPSRAWHIARWRSVLARLARSPSRRHITRLASMRGSAVG